MMKTSKPSSKVKPKKPKLTEEEKREKIRVALLKKKSYEDKAIKLVEEMIEPGVSPSWLVSSATFLNKSYYSDGVEERSLTGICGYPLCENKREQKKNLGKFHISLKDKKVYDLEERRLFCSNWCFKASNYFREQLETSPLWLREVEKPEEVTLYQGVGAVCEGGGKSVDIAIVKRVDIEQVDAVIVDSDGEISDEEEEEHVEVVDEVTALEKLICGEVKKANLDQNGNQSTSGSSKDNITKERAELVKPQARQKINSSDIFEKSVEPVSVSPQAHPCPPSRVVKKIQTPSVNREPAVVVVASALHSWFTIDSFRVVMGDVELKARLEENRVGGDVWATTIGDKDMEEQYQARYRDICRKLDMMERLEEKDEEVEKMPLPSFEMIKEHCEMENLKLSSFMAGKEGYEQELIPKGNIVEKDVEKAEPRLPLLDHKAQQLHRRRIVLDKLMKTLPELLKLFSFSLEEIMGDLRFLVNSFQFAADNVVFRPEEWTLMGLFILKLLALKNSKLKSVLADKNSVKYLKLIMLSHQLEVVVLEQTVRDLTGDVMKLVAKYNIQY